MVRWQFSALLLYHDVSSFCFPTYDEDNNTNKDDPAASFRNQQEEDSEIPDDNVGGDVGNVEQDSADDPDGQEAAAAQLNDGANATQELETT